MAYYLPPEVEYFPHPFLSESEGLLAISDDLTPEQVLLSYQFGIFPWNGPDDPICWWYTYPRLVLSPQKVKVRKSMRRYFNSEIFTISADTAFDEVIHNCRYTKRTDQDGTWITDRIIDTFTELHHRGIAHSIEVWQDNNLVGGLYGIALGKIFFGESMFTKVSDASKFALIHLCRFLENEGYWIIDCQQETSHLSNMGGELWTKEDFFQTLKKNTLQDNSVGSWKGKII